MRHRINGKQLCRDSEHRRAMLRNLAAALFEHGEIETTLPKARAVQPFVEKIITQAKRGGLNARRRIEQMVNDRKIHAWVADPAVNDEKKDNDYFDLPSESEIEFNRYGEVRKAPRLVQHIIANVATRYEDRDGGCTRIVKLGRRRLGDATELVLLQLVGEEDGPELGGGSSRRREKAYNRAAFAAKLRKQFGGDEQAHAESADKAAEELDTATAVADAPAEDQPAEAPDPEASVDDDAATEEEKKD